MGKEKHLIDEDARVHCPIRRMRVDIETCLGCRRLEDFDLDSRRPYLVCRGPEDDRPEQRVAGA